ncbi:DUF4333 domain-containing protein [Gordonia alkaliphila]|uniref:DUF4333 domain-containing protein n=1 Tax=Gordonia alkaliphila TaxID=1053547 RepID=UPI001FF23B9C|nr:DUF4333 domain-containing protein [Gordonia alkaliphila]MCK0438628.1 DUF4333 domain-containing protein [Gordonia alkaliphila]
MNQDLLQSEIAEELGKNMSEPPAVRCAGGIKGRVGNTQTCEVQILGTWYAYTITVTSADEDGFRYNISPDNPELIPDTMPE